MSQTVLSPGGPNSSTPPCQPLTRGRPHPLGFVLNRVSRPLIAKPSTSSSLFPPKKFYPGNRNSLTVEIWSLRFTKIGRNSVSFLSFFLRLKILSFNWIFVTNLKWMRFWSNSLKWCNFFKNCFIFNSVRRGQMGLNQLCQLGYESVTAYYDIMSL